MRVIPYYPQHDAMDCGPTCLRMVAAYYGKRYSLDGREKCYGTATESATVFVGEVSVSVRIAITKHCRDIKVLFANSTFISFLLFANSK